MEILKTHWGWIWKLLLFGGITLLAIEGCKGCAESVKIYREKHEVEHRIITIENDTITIYKDLLDGNLRLKQ